MILRFSHILCIFMTVSTFVITISVLKVIHEGGQQFLQHVKLIMAKFNIQDWGAMSDEHAKIRIEELAKNLNNAVETGSIIKPKNESISVVFRVDEDQNLLLLDGNEVITVDAKEAIHQIKNYKEIIEVYKKEFDKNIETNILEIADGISDAGLILGKTDSLKFLYQQFNDKIKRNHSNFREWTNLFQCFLDIIYWRRVNRVNKYIKDNTHKFQEKQKDVIDRLEQQSERELSKIKDKMRICKSICSNDQNEDECYYLCLLSQNHENENEHGIFYNL